MATDPEPAREAGSEDSAAPRPRPRTEDPDPDELVSEPGDADEVG